MVSFVQMELMVTMKPTNVKNVTITVIDVMVQDLKIVTIVIILSYIMAHV